MEDPAKLLRDIQQCLKQHAVDFETSRKKFKIKAVVYASPLPTKLHICIYKGDSAEIVVEFQKRDGSVSACVQTFQKVVSQLGSRVDRLCAPSQCTQSKTLTCPALSPPPALPPLDTVCVEVVAAAQQKLIEHLMEMVQGGYWDQQKQAVAELVDISSVCGDRLVDCQQGIADVLLGLLASDDEDIVRCAALILANTVTAIAPLCQDVGQLLDSMFDVLESPGSLVNADTKRHMTQALGSIAQTHGKHFSEQHLSALRRYSSTSDATLRENIGYVESVLKQRAPPAIRV